MHTRETTERAKTLNKLNAYRQTATAFNTNTYIHYTLIVIEPEINSTAQTCYQSTKYTPVENMSVRFTQSHAHRG